MKFLAFLTLFLSFNVLAGRPVIHDLTRRQLIERSQFVFSGWPSAETAVGSCAHQTGRWWVHKVYRGDKSLEGKVIPIADHKYQLFAAAKGGKLPSYPSYRYGQGQINREQGTSFLFTSQNKDGCFELVAQGAQESRMKEIEIAALFADPKDCATVLRGFVYRTDQMPVDCVTHLDCQLFSAHPNSCERPFIWNKKAEAKIDDEFKELQGLARAACADQWKQQTACAPKVLPIRCHAGRCQEGFEPSVTKAKLSMATMKEACAPHDALSKLILVTDGKNEFPVLSINWWGNSRPSAKGGTFKLSAKSSDTFQDGYQVAYCTSRGSCKLVQKFEAKLIWEKDRNEGKLEYSFTTDDDVPISGSVPVQSVSDGQMVLCG